MTPPAHTWNIGFCPAIKAIIATVPMKQTGVIGEITFFQMRNSPPIKSATALTSPRDPPVNPKNKSRLEGIDPFPPSFRIPRGVGPVKASVAAFLGTGHVVICVAKDTNKTTLAVIAGLNRFLPIPPNRHFTRIIATAAPTMAM